MRPGNPVSLAFLTNVIDPPGIYMQLCWWHRRDALHRTNCSRILPLDAQGQVTLEWPGLRVSESAFQAMMKEVPALHCGITSPVSKHQLQLPMLFAVAALRMTSFKGFPGWGVARTSRTSRNTLSPTGSHNPGGAHSASRLLPVVTGSSGPILTGRPFVSPDWLVRPE